jgi:glutaminyl-peptide cyclotransferase
MPLLLLLFAAVWNLGEIIGHDPGAYTQGLELHNGVLYESTGLYGQSSLRRVNPATGEVLMLRRLPDSLFAEGLTLVSPSRMLVLTWREGLVLVVNPTTLEIIETLPLQGEGWGLCYDGSRVIRSDGSATLRFHDPKTMEVTDSVTVTLGGVSQRNINELEYARDLIWANQWLSNRILTIDPATGTVLSVLDFSRLAPPGGGGMNGIAYDRERDVFIITGKNWPVMYTVDIDLR